MKHSLKTMEDIGNPTIGRTGEYIQIGICEDQ